MEEAIICPKVDKVYAATTNLVKNIPSEKRELLSVVHIFERSHESESDDAPLEILLSEFTENVPYDNLVILQCTNPFTESKDIAEVFRLLSEYDSIVSVCRQKRFLWNNGFPVRHTLDARIRTQDMEGYSVENGALYATTRKQFKDSGFRCGGKIGLYEMPPYTYYEIDDENDWEICKTIHARYLKEQGIPVI